MIQFQIITDPVAKARPRFSRKTMSVYTPLKTRSFERQVSCVAKSYIKNPLLGAVELVITFNFKKAKSNKRKFHTMKPDIDNLIKGVMDGLNKIAFKDDCQVVDLIIKKRYAPQDGFIEVSLQELI
jgi:Holliday junction resolvase RusA-like endonuclease